MENGKCAALDSNCGGVPCTSTEKEDSTTSDPVPLGETPAVVDDTGNKGARKGSSRRTTKR